MTNNLKNFVDGPKGIPRLEELTCIKISVVIWSNECFQGYMKKQKNGIIYLEKPLKIIKEVISQFELVYSVKKSLMEVSERVGYELYVFMSESTLNTCNPKQFLSSSFSNYTVDDVNIRSDVKWTLKGEISMTDTLTYYMKNHLNASPLLLFMCACEICDEHNVMSVWNNRLSDEQKNQIKKSRSWSKNHIFLNYWLCLFDNNFDDFIRFYGDNILTFDERHTLNYNLLKYSIMRCFRNNIAYFYSKLTRNEKACFVDENNVEVSGERAILFHVLQSETFWYVKYINKFFEIPLLNHKVNQFIICKLPEHSFKDLIEYNIQQVNTFGDLHCNIFLYLMAIASDKVKKIPTLKDILSLISKGRLEPVVDYLLNEETKKVLREQILNDFKNLRLSKFLRVCMNGQSDLLACFFDSICDKDDDRLFLKIRLKSIMEGNQYEEQR